MELVDILNKKKENAGYTKNRKSLEDDEYRLSIHVWITNSKGEFLIQKRAANKSVFPNLWNETGGAAMAGETSAMACAREFEEELGVEPNMESAKLIGTIKRVNDFVDVWHIEQDININDINMQIEEVSEVKWAKLKEIKKLIKSGEFVPTIEPSLNLFIQYLKLYNKKSK